MSITGIDHVQVAAPAGCEAEARRFYGALLGLPELDKPAPLRSRGGAWFAAGAQQLHVGVADPFVAATKAHPALRADSLAELEALAERLAAAGETVIWDDELRGVARFFTADPWGNRLELLAVEPRAGRANH